MAHNQAQNLELLIEVGRLLSSKLELEDLLVTVLKLAAEVVDAETASLLLLDEKSGELYFHTALGLGEETSRMRLPLGQGIAGCVAKNRSPEIINDVRCDPRWSPRMDKQSGFKTASILAVPMLFKGRLLGVIEAINKSTGAFHEDDLRTFEAFASQAAVAIDNATLFASLKGEQLKLSTVFTQITDGVIMTDAAGRILLTNDAARKFFSVGTELVDLSGALQGMTATPPLETLMAGTEDAYDLTLRRDQPQLLILAGKATRIAPGRTGSGNMAGRLLILRDVTEEAQKLSLKRTFLSLISHKLKTPLAAVMGFSDIILDEFAAHAPDPMTLKAAQSIAAQSQKLAGLVDKLLRYTTLESPENNLDLAPCPLDEVVSEAISGFQDWLTANKAIVDFRSSGLSVTGDRKFLGDVVKNLVENAVKFGDKPKKKVSVWIDAEGEEVRLHIQDNGPGIPPEEQDRIFSQFHQVESSFTGQVDGWGLGLPYVRKVAALHGGRVSLVSKLGQGTTVTVCLPRKKT
ncbi:MAG: ATP-binding protein [Elusimicrobiota bacterium]|jgi:signal transduction histidine kinase